MSKTVEEAAAVEALVQHARHGDRGALAGLYDRNCGTWPPSSPARSPS
jgi:hypothetical protein